MWKTQINELSDNRFVLAIDAASLKVNVGIHPNGTTFGLVNNVKLSPNEIINHRQNFDNFLIQYPDHAKYVFVILLCPLDPHLKPIIISRKYSIKGNATTDEISDLQRAKKTLDILGLKCVGFASDGDSKYQSSATNFVDWMITDLLNIVTKPLMNFISYSALDAWFQDVLHMLKNHRYHLLRNRPLQLVFGLDIVISSENFLQCFDIVGKSVLNNGHNTKMDDRLAFRFFDWINIVQVLHNNIMLLPVLLPSALLLQFFFNKRISREHRYHLLNCGAAIVFVQRLLYLESLKQPSSKDNEKDNEKNKKPMHPYHKTWMDKYLHLAASVASLFGDNRSFDLSDCGSHLLEHLYGLIRRFSGGNDSQEKFDQSLEKSICLRKWSSDLHIPGYIPGRLPQDSAAKVESVNDFSESPPSGPPPFGSYVIWATKLLMGIFNSLPKSQKLNTVMERNADLPLIVFHFDIPNDEQFVSNSQRQNFSINYNGNRNDIRNNTIWQDKKYMNNLQSNSESKQIQNLESKQIQNHIDEDESDSEIEEVIFEEQENINAQNPNDITEIEEINLNINPMEEHESINQKLSDDIDELDDLITEAEYYPFEYLDQLSLHFIKSDSNTC